jgi:hypothetical protein
MVSLARLLRGRCSRMYCFHSRWTCVHGLGFNIEPWHNGSSDALIRAPAAHQARTRVNGTADKLYECQCGAVQSPESILASPTEGMHPLTLQRNHKNSRIPKARPPERRVGALNAPARRCRLQPAGIAIAWRTSRPGRSRRAAHRCRSRSVVRPRIDSARSTRR